WGEAFPNVIAEAMCIGLPCVTTDVGDSRDIVGESGLVVIPGDDDALAKGVLAMLGKTADDRRELGLSARARIERNYALPAIVRQYVELYQTLRN
ncbi:MAG: glycosyltransferase, partial [Methylomicrobium sp.]|nr:glycosyltransferase [Methylomicrobium sp.]